VDTLKSYALVLARKMGLVAVGWVGVYFLSQKFRTPGQDGINILMLFAPLIGAIAGLVAGWYVATDAVEDSQMSGLGLWVILVAASVIPMWVVEWVMHLIFPTWPMEFGGFMVVASANLLALASAVWHASAQE
jgi:hypothetical protein